ncbi:MAG: hypothetical protein JOY77_09025 [Alphaproteobacteria bacterium]|nr:hypothetical protein [Alphaproteobacteria bacterium]
MTMARRNPRTRVGIVSQGGGNSGKAVNKQAPITKVKRAAVRAQKPVGVDPGDPRYGINMQNVGVNVGNPGRLSGAVTQRIPSSNYQMAKKAIMEDTDG